MEVGIIRQGDVLLVPVEGVEPVSKGGTGDVVLALGESTGHAHRLLGNVVEWSVGDQRYVRVLGDEPGRLVHEDHDPIPAAVVAPEVTYRVIQQREWDLSGQWKKVQD